MGCLGFPWKSWRMGIPGHMSHSLTLQTVKGTSLGWSKLRSMTLADIMKGLNRRRVLIQTPKKRTRRTGHEGREGVTIGGSMLGVWNHLLLLPGLPPEPAQRSHCGIRTQGYTITFYLGQRLETQALSA